MNTIPQMIISEAQAQGVDPSLALEVAQMESGMNQARVSPVGAVGVMQLMPDTAQGLGVDQNDVQQNIHGGVMYLAQMLARFGDPKAALAAYNWGPGNVASAIAANGTDFISIQGVPTMPAWLAAAPPSVQKYVNTILSNVNTQYSVVAAATAAAAGTPTPGGSTSTLMLPTGSPSGLLPGVPAPPVAGFSWGTAALITGIVLGIGLVVSEV